MPQEPPQGIPVDPRAVDKATRRSLAEMNDEFARRQLSALAEFIRDTTGLDITRKGAEKAAEKTARLNLLQSIAVKGILGNEAGDNEENRIAAEELARRRRAALEEFARHLAIGRAQFGIPLVFRAVNMPVWERDP